MAYRCDKSTRAARSQRSLQKQEFSICARESAADRTNPRVELYPPLGVVETPPEVLVDAVLGAVEVSVEVAPVDAVAPVDEAAAMVDAPMVDAPLVAAPLDEALAEAAPPSDPGPAAGRFGSVTSM